MPVTRLSIYILAIAMAIAPRAVCAQGAGAASCALAATPLAFGRYAPSSGAPSDFTATLTVACSASSPTPVPVQGTIALLGGSAGRRLTSGPQALRYQLYLDPARTIPWGDGTGGSRTMSVSGVVSASAAFRQALTVYGRVLARQSDARVGDYADQITAVLDY